MYSVFGAAECSAASFHEFFVKPGPPFWFWLARGAGLGYNNADFCFASRREQGATIREDENNMSASREKKQRQTDGTLDQRQRKSDSQAAQAKRKRIGYTVIGAVIVVRRDFFW